MSTSRFLFFSSVAFRHLGWEVLDLGFEELGARLRAALCLVGSSLHTPIQAGFACTISGQPLAFLIRCLESFLILPLKSLLDLPRITHLPPGQT